VGVGQEPAVRGLHGDQREAEPAGVVASPEAGLLVQDPDHDRGGAVVAHLGVLDHERTVLQPVAEAAEPLVAAKDEAQRAHADEVVAQQAVERLGVVALLGGGPALDQVQHVGGSGHQTLPCSRRPTFLD
jgi:hypothetical protein